MLKQLEKRNFEIRSYPENLEQRNNLISSMENMLKQAKQENRSFSVEELEDFNSKKLEVATLDSKEELKALSTRSVGKAAKEITPEIRSFIEYLTEKRGLAAGSNGAIIPVSISTMVIQKIKELSPVLSEATIFSVKGDLEVPSYSWDTITAGYVPELTPVTGSGGNFTGVKLGSVIAGALTVLSNSLINRSADLDVVSIIVLQLARSLTDFLERELLVGTGGAGKIQGSLATGITNNVTGATTLTITSDELIDVQMGIKSVYQDGALWIMAPTTYKMIRKLKDTQNRYLIGNMETGDGFTLLGKPVYLSENMPVLGVGAKAIFYGNLKGLSIKFAQEMQVKVLQERFADSYSTGIIGFVEIDAVVSDAQALSMYTGK
ncbi:phage major capsid protein [Bacillus sp. AFS017336]|uniref:phage major capsid protein n=1 Tax=Bacillus sp. AFS017336 TaxID=2033489 RepID=UPI000BF08C62|nr:phage major capsid protein [Bacillus sp. AFS017336]PEL07796.1 phage major capsid protein [Bacillus sp. AFS017336]